MPFPAPNSCRPLKEREPHWVLSARCGAPRWEAGSPGSLLFVLRSLPHPRSLGTCVTNSLCAKVGGSGKLSS